jgi:hypothetical protein
VTNIIEIRVQTVNDIAAGLAGAKADAVSGAQEIAGIFEEAGGEAGDGFAAAFAAALGGSIGKSAAPAGEEIAGALTESAAGAGDAMAAEIGDALGTGLASAGERAGAAASDGIASGLDAARSEAESAAGAIGAALAEGVAEGASGAGDAIGQQLGDGLSGKAQAAGTQAGQALAEGFDNATAGLGQETAQHVETALSGLAPAASSAGSAAGTALEASVAHGLAALAFAGAAAGTELALGITAGAAAAVGAVAGIAEAIQAQLTGELSEAGASSGSELGISVGDGAQSSAGSAASMIARALEADLADALAESGGAAGISLLHGIQDGATGGGKTVAAKIASAIEAPLTDAMGEVGAEAVGALFTQVSAGLDVTVAEMGAFAGRLGALRAQAGTAAAGPVAQAAQEAAEEAPAAQEAIAEALGAAEAKAIDEASARAEAAAAAAGPRIAAAVRTSMATAVHGGMAGGPNVDPSELLASLSPQAFDPLVPDLASSVSGAFTRASKLGLQDAVAAAQSEWGAELAGLVPSPERFSSLTDKGIALWTEEVRAQVAEAGPGLADAFSNAMALGLGGMDWSSLTGAQATALMGAIRGSLVEGADAAAPQAEAAMEQLGAESTEALAVAVQSTGSAVADALIGKIVEAREAATAQLVELAVAAGQEGDEAGGRFATFFSQAVNSVRLVFAQDPEKAAEAGAEAGRQYADAMVEQLEAEFGELPQAAAEEGEEAGGAFGQFFSSAASAVLGVFAKDPAAAAGAEAGAEFGDAMVEQLEARLAAIGESGDAGFAATLEQQLEAQLRAAAQEATAAYEQQLVEGIAEAETEAQAQLGEMRMDVNLDQMFSNLTQSLPADFVNAFSAVRQGIAVTEEEFAQFSEYGQQQLRALVTVLDTEGVQAADQFMEALSTKSFNERLNPASLMAGSSSEMEGVASEFGGVEKAAAGAAASVGGMGAMMSGPLMMGAMGAMTILPMLSGLFTSSAASASDFTSAVSQDSNAVGDNTAATIQQTLAKSNLAGISNQLGLSQSQLIEYAAGEANVQAQVTAAYNAQTEALQKNQQQTRVTAGKSGANADNPSAQSLSQLQQQKAALDAVAAAVAAAVNEDAANSAALLAAEQTTKIYDASVAALGESQLLQVQQTKMSNQATSEYGSQLLAAASSASYAAAAVGANGVNMQLQAQATQYTNEATVQYGNNVLVMARSTQAFNAALGASNMTMQLNAQNSAISSVGLLNLGNSQLGLNQKLVSSETAYAEAQQGASAYSAAVTALNGDAMSLAQAQNTLAGDMVSAKATFDQNSDSLKLNTQAGVNDREALVSASQSIVAMAVAQYQSTGNMNDANKTISQQITAYVNATGATGKAKTAIESYLESITHIPANVSTTVHANTSTASSAISSLQNQLALLEFQGVNSVQQQVSLVKQEMGHAAGGFSGMSYAAQGGSQYGGPTMINEQGAEMVNLPNGSQVMPAANTASMMANGFGMGPQRIQLEWVGASDDPLFEMLRQGIRVRGGGGSNSVQRALGQVTR